MEFAMDERTAQLAEQVRAFLDEVVYPAEAEFEAQMEAEPDRWDSPPLMADLKREAQRRGLWNLFLPDAEHGAGLTNLQYAHLAELSGRSPRLAPEAMNCAAPDTGNMELLAQFGTPEQHDRWLKPLLAGQIRSCFSMTEPEVASSDANNIALRITRDGDEYVVHGRKWWSSGAMNPRCEVSIVMGVSDPDGPRHRRHSMVLVPLDTPGVTRLRSTHVFGYDDRSHGGHAEIEFDQVRVPVANLVGGEHEGFAIAQARLGPGRIHHCMRLIGMAERALELMCRRVLSRDTFGGPIADKGVVQEWIADARIEIEQARLLVLKTAWLMDTVGNRGARTEIAAIKVIVPAMACRVVDRAIQAHGATGVSQDTPLASLYAHARTLQIADGPDEVHRRTVAQRELAQYR
ncbi:acyl-CoA dehydrogenase family protein [Catellatospora sp. KI3]|uniref:acyl-CoA dehydrogenase family protein n=1 Tax=Catellatospora sp. KI3 TaxID=3041620 RepID=UPI0024823210|nr:acyl-CoA dehydrogenase family protein [Catellatospora sp. KI3]MDI1462497.1 acyl-CoA dehydrogenase family protein [Catellatospora sp. KI3]